MLVPISMGTNMAAGNRKKHLEFTFARTEKFVFSCEHSKI